MYQAGERGSTDTVYEAGIVSMLVEEPWNVRGGIVVVGGTGHRVPATQHTMGRQLVDGEWKAQLGWKG